MYQFLVLVNTRTKEAWATGYKKCKPHYTKEKIYKITTLYDEASNNNYAQWAKRFQTIDEFTYEFFYSETSEEVRNKASNWITENEWELYPSKTRPTKT